MALNLLMCSNCMQLLHQGLNTAFQTLTFDATLLRHSAFRDCVMSQLVEDQFSKAVQGCSRGRFDTVRAIFYITSWYFIISHYSPLVTTITISNHNDVIHHDYIRNLPLVTTITYISNYIVISNHYASEADPSLPKPKPKPVPLVAPQQTPEAPDPDPCCWGGTVAPVSRWVVTIAPPVSESPLESAILDQKFLISPNFWSLGSLRNEDTNPKHAGHWEVANGYGSKPWHPLFTAKWIHRWDPPWRTKTSPGASSAW